MIYTVTSCNGYNAIMYNHLSNPNSYSSHLVNVRDISHFNLESEKIYLDVTFSTKEELASFVGLSPDNINYDPNERVISLEVIGENVIVLWNNNFNDLIKIGDCITVYVSNLIYMDSDFFYIVGLSKDDNVLLDFDTGLKNVITLMDEHRSLI